MEMAGKLIAAPTLSQAVSGLISAETIRIAVGYQSKCRGKCIQ